MAPEMTAVSYPNSNPPRAATALNRVAYERDFMGYRDAMWD
jgi:hypothetical protein